MLIQKRINVNEQVVLIEYLSKETVNIGVYFISHLNTKLAYIIQNLLAGFIFPKRIIKPDH